LNRVIKAFDPNQARDEHGRWTGGGAHFEVTDAGPAAVIVAAPTPEQDPELPEQQTSSHFLSSTGDLLTRLGSIAYDVGAALHSARGLRNATTRTQIALHVGVIASTLVALKTHISHLPEEARIWSSEAVATLHRTRDLLLELKHRIFAERNSEDVNKVAKEITSLLIAGAYV
jgi:hypothetical protein